MVDSPFADVAEGMGVHTSRARVEVRDTGPGAAAAAFASVPVPGELETHLASAHDYLGQQLVCRRIRMGRWRPC